MYACMQTMDIITYNEDKRSVFNYLREIEKVVCNGKSLLREHV